MWTECKGSFSCVAVRFVVVVAVVVVVVSAKRADIIPIEAFADLVTEYIKSSIRVLLKDAFRLHQPTATKVDLKIKRRCHQICIRKPQLPSREIEISAVF